MKRRLRLILGLLAGCLVGIYGFQAYWLWASYQLAEAEFARAAREALEAVVQQQQLARAKQVFSFVLDDRDGPAIRTRPDRAGGVDSFVHVRLVPGGSQPTTLRQLLATSSPSAKARVYPRPPLTHGTSVAIKLLETASMDRFKRLNRQQPDSLRARQPAGSRTSTIVLIRPLPGQPGRKLRLGLPGPKLIRSLLVQTDKRRPVRPDSLASQLSRLVVSSWQHNQATNLPQLARAYRAELRRRQAEQPFQLDTLPAKGQPMFRVRAPGTNGPVPVRVLPSRPGFTVHTPPVLLNPVRGPWVGASFRPPTAYVLRRLAGSLAGSVALLGLTTGCFALMLSTILRQKKLAEVRNDFINNMTHELKTPLATVSAAMEALQDFGALHDARKTDTYLTMARQEVRRLTDLVDKVLHIAVQERPGHALPLHPEPVRPAELVAGLVSRHELQATKPVRFEVSIAPTTTLLLDRLHLAGALHNLLDNALKYSGARVAVRICGRRADGGWQLTVADDGPGIAPGYQEAIFEQFFRVPTGNLHPVKGFGLGLYYVRQVVAAHGGRVRVRPAPGGGSEFVIWLPELVVTA